MACKSPSINFPLVAPLIMWHPLFGKKKPLQRICILIRVDKLIQRRIKPANNRSIPASREEGPQSSVSAEDTIPRSMFALAPTSLPETGTTTANPISTLIIMAWKVEEYICMNQTYVSIAVLQSPKHFHCGSAAVHVHLRVLSVCGGSNFCPSSCRPHQGMFPPTVVWKIGNVVCLSQCCSRHPQNLMPLCLAHSHRTCIPLLNSARAFHSTPLMPGTIHGLSTGMEEENQK